jgi:hypothetical protein
MQADYVRAAANIVIDALPLVANRGHNFYKWDEVDDNQVRHHTEHEIFTIEVFPKQTQINSDGFGNLMRLPLGRNLKSEDPTFFVDMDSNAPLSELRPADPVKVLTDVLAKMPK